MTDFWRKKYEEDFCKLVDVKAARAFRLGRHALVILLKALDVKEGDRIGVCSFTCLSVIEAVKVCGATPVYLDVDEYLCIDPREILRQKTGSLKVVILQHTFGCPGRLEQLLTACSKINAKVVEDCAHSLGCSWNNKKLGKFAEGAIYSFQWGKPYSTGQGGMLTVNSNRLLDNIDCQIEKSAITASTGSELLLACQRPAYSILGKTRLACYLRHHYSKLRDLRLSSGTFLPKGNFNFYPGYIRLAGRLTAKAGTKQIANWPRLQQLRRQNTAMIEEYLIKADLPLWPKPSQADITMLRYPLLTQKKSEIVSQAAKQGLDIAGWYISPVHPLKGDDLVKVGYQQGSCPKAESTINQLIHLPTDSSLDKLRLEAIVKIIRKVTRGNRAIHFGTQTNHGEYKAYVNPDPR
jgi:dTDP-4-amino-4,6-dideoxygalactose transaminase